MEWVRLTEADAGDYRRKVLQNWTWTWTAGESWVIHGANGSGKSALAALLLGQMDLLAGTMDRHPDWQGAEEGWIGFERQKKLLDFERWNDDSELRDTPDPGTLVKSFCGTAGAVERFGLKGKENRGLKHLSTGELRRACLARAWHLRLPFWILDEPFEGLDVQACADLKALLEEEIRQGQDMLFLTRRLDDVPAGFTHRLEVDRGRIVGSGPVGNSFVPEKNPVPLHLDTRAEPGAPVIEFRRVTAGYGDLHLFENFDWTVRQGERWLVHGPNGSGKSTLLSLIAGEHPQVFSNEIRLFGLRRGPELTLADLKKRLSFLSYAYHQQFRHLFQVTNLEVAVSGAYQTIGLYEEPGWEAVQRAKEVMDLLGLGTVRDQYWEETSFGVQRLVLLARALVKTPGLLLLDEPCHALDGEHQDRFLENLGRAVDREGLTLLYVTHRTDEIRMSDFQVLELPQRRI